MDLFYIIVLTVAIIVLILVLTYMGLAMKNSSATSTYPGKQEICPDYWNLTTDGSSCIIPTTGKNMGTSSQVKLADGYTYGLSSDGKAINFQSPLWTSTGVSTTCAYQRWAKNYGIVWDGVTNFNGCK
jgi:hypothetical protein